MIFVLVFGIVIGLVVNFVNLHTDFQDCHDFYRGYMGRRLLISEGKLTSRAYLEAINTLKDQQKVKKEGMQSLLTFGVDIFSSFINRISNVAKVI